MNSPGVNEVDDLKARIEQLQELEDEVPKLRALNETLKAKLKEAEKKLIDETNVNPANRKDASSEWSAEKARMELELSSLKSSLKAAEEGNAALKSAYESSLTVPTSSFSSSAHEAQMDALRAELDSLTSSKSSLEIELKVTKSSLASHAQRLADMTEKQTRAEEVLQRYEQLCEEVEDSRERAELAEASLNEATKVRERPPRGLSLP